MTDTVEAEQQRPLRPALRYGWKQRCPNCGQGQLFKSFLAVRETCPVCREELHHQRADDGPAYLTVLIVGHIIGPMVLWGFLRWPNHPLTLIVVLAVFSVALSLYLLPRIKGMIIAYQWSRYMHGFGNDGPDPDHMR